jgi:hypothetical protein
MLDSLSRRTLPDFAGNLATMGNAFPEPLWSEIREEAGQLVETERNYLPVHKKGGTVAYETLEVRTPKLTRLYRSEAMCRLVSDIVGIEIKPTPFHDQSSCSLLYYEKPGDHIGWHYDHNFYKGRHFTVLIPLINFGKEGLSAARLMVRRRNRDIVIPTPPNSLIVFEGAKVRHKVTPIAEGERRVVWSMTYCADPRNSAWQGVKRRFKDTAFFGLRALWT